MKFRKLRIAWSVVCGLACLPLIVLWVRSYSREDFASATILGRLISIESKDGNAAMFCIESPDGTDSLPSSLLEEPVGETQYFWSVLSNTDSSGFGIKFVVH